MRSALFTRGAARRKAKPCGRASRGLGSLLPLGRGRSFSPQCLRARFIPDYLQLVEPDSAQHLELSRFEFVTPSHAAEDCTTSVVALVPSRRGESVTLIIQVLAEQPSPSAFTDLLGRHFAALELHYRQPILLSVLCLRGARPGVYLETAVAQRVFGVEVLQTFYTTFGLANSRAEYYPCQAALMCPSRLDYPRLFEECRARVDLLIEDKGRRLLRAIIDSAELLHSPPPSSGPLGALGAFKRTPPLTSVPGEEKPISSIFWRFGPSRVRLLLASLLQAGDRRAAPRRVEGRPTRGGARRRVGPRLRRCSPGCCSSPDRLRHSDWAKSWFR